MKRAEPARLLIVDDIQDHLDMLAIFLGRFFTVATCGSPAEALRALDTVKPDLLVLDIGMGPVDGLECLAAIRAVPGYERIPALALTAFARESDRKAFLAAGFQAVVTKPILDERRLAAVIDRLLRVGTSSHRGATDAVPAS